MAVSSIFPINYPLATSSIVISTHKLRSDQMKYHRRVFHHCHYLRVKMTMAKKTHNKSIDCENQLKKLHVFPLILNERMTPNSINISRYFSKDCSGRSNNVHQMISIPSCKSNIFKPVLVTMNASKKLNESLIEL